MRLRGVPMCLDDGRRRGSSGLGAVVVVVRPGRQAATVPRGCRPWTAMSIRAALMSTRFFTTNSPSAVSSNGDPDHGHLLPLVRRHPVCGRRRKESRGRREIPPAAGHAANAVTAPRTTEDGPDQPLGPADVRRVPSASRPRPGRPRRRLPKRRPQTDVPSATPGVVAAPVRGPPRRELRTTRTSSGPGVRDSTTARRRNSQRSPMRPRLRTRRPGPRSQGPPGRASGQDRPVLCWAETPLRVLDARPATADGRKST
ncbi:MAG: hypothetical protein JWR45_2861 [Blastococcus sp.]|nr:hypothetical protein [Blastococcus sp.]